MLKRYLLGCLLTAVSLSVALLSGCTDPGLCYEEEHPHSGNVQFSYDWGNYASIPDSMAIVAVRVINHWKCGMMMQTTGSPLLGHYFYNPPSKVEAWVDPNLPPPPPPPAITGYDLTIDPGEDYNGGVGPRQPEGEEGEEEVDKTTIVVDHYDLPGGTYKFYAIGMDDALYDHVYTNVGEYLRAAGTGMQYSEIEMIYNTHRYGDEGFENLLGEDYNFGFDLIKTDYPPVYIDRLELLDIEQSHAANIAIRPQPLTQHVDIYLDIQKDISSKPFTIDNVVGEISGIPSKASAFDGHLYLAKTNKMQFHTALNDEGGTSREDSNGNDHVRVHAALDVLSILHSETPTDVTGPGILQLAITYRTTETNADGQPYVKIWKVQGKINLYYLLKEANLITYSDDWQYATKSVDNVVLNIPTAIRLSANGMMSSSGGNADGGFDQWQSCGEVITDNGDDIELY